jgi:hypothetical protein
MQIASYKYKLRHTSTNCVIQVQIASYKYKFRHTSTNSNQYSRKLVKLKLYIFLMYSRKFLFCCLPTWTVKVKNKTSLSDYRTVWLSDYAMLPLYTKVNSDKYRFHTCWILNVKSMLPFFTVATYRLVFGQLKWQMIT